MSTFNYTAVDNLGRKKKGVLSAQSEIEARKFIKDLNLTPISVKQLQGIKGIKSKVKNKDIVIMTRQIATLLEADTSIIDALKITADQISNKDLVNILFSLREDVVQGKRLGQSMMKYTGVFNNTY